MPFLSFIDATPQPDVTFHEQVNYIYPIAYAYQIQPEILNISNSKYINQSYSSRQGHPSINIRTILYIQ
jgi:hypothetical protein